MQRNPLAIPVAVLAFSTGCKDFDLCPEKSDGVCLPFFGGNGDDSEPTATTSTTGATDADSVTTSTTGTDMTAEPATTDQTGTTDDTTGSTTMPPDLCGNKIRDPGEACDDGVNDGSYGGCQPDCTALGPFCGDGRKEGEETCDHGLVNGNYGFCNTTCSGHGPHCGDNVVQPIHEACDGGEACNTDCTLKCGDGNLDDGESCDDSNNVDYDGCTTDCQKERFVFVTSEDYTGANIGGIMTANGADDKCNTLAHTAGIAENRKFKAWLSDSNSAPAMRFETSFAGHYYMSPGTPIADGWSALTTQILNPINSDENGAPKENSQVWTNTDSKGLAIGTKHCVGWTETVDYSAVGNTKPIQADDWTDETTNSCGTSLPFYCFEDYK